MSTFSILQQVFKESFGDDSLKISLEDSRENPGQIEGWDSLKNVELLHCIEQKFEIRLTLQELQDMNSIGDMMQIIKSKLDVSN